MRDLKKIWVRLRSRMVYFIRRRNIWTFALFLLFATVLWLGHALNSVRERTVHIGIEYLGIPDNVIFTEPLAEQFDIKIRDQGKRLFHYKKGVLQSVQIDLSSQLRHESGSVAITAEQVRQKITDQLQGTAKLQLIKPELISSGYYKQALKKVRVVLSSDMQPASQYQFTQLPLIEPQQITVFGKKEQLDTIREVYTEHIKQTNIKDTLRLEIGLSLPQGVTTKTERVQLSCVAERFTEKHFHLPLVVRNVPDGMRVITFPSVVELKMQVPMSQFADFTEADIEAWCNMPNADDKQLKVNVSSKKNLPKEIYLNPPTVEYIIEK